MSRFRNRRRSPMPRKRSATSAPVRRRRRGGARGSRVSSQTGRGKITRLRAGRAKTRKRGVTHSGETFRSATRTINHYEIRQWVELRGGHPATVKHMAKGRQHIGVLRIDFPGHGGRQSLKPVSWEEWFQIFDQQQLAFLYQETTSAGKENRFNKLVNRHD